MSDVIDIENARRARQERQAYVDKHAAVPENLTAAEDIAIMTTSEDASRVRGIGLFPPPPGCDYWELTPDMADALGMELVRLAQAAREKGCGA